MKKIRRIINFVLCAAMILGLCPAVSSAVSYASPGTNISVKYTGNSVEIYCTDTSKPGVMADFTLETGPEWRYKSNLESVVIHRGIQNIGDYAFYGMDIQTVTIGKTGSGSTPFTGGIGVCAFYKTKYLQTVDFYNDAAPSVIWNKAFANSAIKTINFYNGAASLERIEDCAFEWSGIREIWPGSSLANIVRIGESAFERCTSNGNGMWLKLSDFSGLKAIGTRAFYQAAFDSARFSDETTRLPDSLLSICEEAFNGTSGLNRIEIGENVKVYGTRAFANCRCEVVLPASMKGIPPELFISSAVSIVIPETVKCIYSGAFGTDASAMFNDPVKLIFLGDAPISYAGSFGTGKTYEIYYNSNKAGWENFRAGHSGSNFKWHDYADGKEKNSSVLRNILTQISFKPSEDSSPDFNYDIVPVDTAANDNHTFWWEEGTAFRFRIVPKEGFQAASGFKVYQKGSDDKDRIISPDTSGIYTVTPEKGQNAIYVSGVGLSNPFMTTPSSRTVYMENGSASFSYDFSVSDFARNKIKAASTSNPAKLYLVSTSDGSKTQITKDKLVNGKVTQSVTRTGLSEGFSEGYRLRIEVYNPVTKEHSLSYDSPEFTFTYTPDVSRADNEWPSSVDIYVGTEKYTLTDTIPELTVSGELIARYSPSEKQFCIYKDVNRIVTGDTYFGVLTLTAGTGVSITGYDMSGDMPTIDVSGDIMVMPNDFSIQGSYGNPCIETGGNCIIDGSVSDPKSLTLTANGGTSATAIRSAKSITLNNYGNTFINMNASSMTPFVCADTDGAGISNCGALVITYGQNVSYAQDTEPYANVHAFMFDYYYAYSRATDINSKQVEIFKRGIRRTVSLQQTDGGMEESYFTLKIGGNTYKAGSVMQITSGSDAYFMIAEPKSGYSFASGKAGIYLKGKGTQPEATGNTVGNLNEYKSTDTGDAVIFVNYKQSMFHTVEFTHDGSGHGKLSWSYEYGAPVRLSGKCTYEDGHTVTYAFSDYISAQCYMFNSNNDPSKNIIAVQLIGYPQDSTEGVGSDTVYIDWNSMYVDYTDPEREYNSNADIADGIVTTVAEIDFSQFVHGGSGVFNYSVSLRDDNSHNYSFSFNQKTGLLRILRDYARNNCGDDAYGRPYCKVVVEDEMTGDTQTLRFYVGSFTEDASVVTYPTFVNGMQVTNKNKNDVLGDGTVSYTEADEDSCAVLHLKKANITTARNELIKSEGYCGGILSGEELIIDIEGINYIDFDLNDYISGPNAITVGDLESDNLGAVVAAGTHNYFTLSGSGTLNITGIYNFSSYDSCILDGPTVLSYTQNSTGNSTSLKYRSGTIYSLLPMDDFYETLAWGGTKPLSLLIDENAGNYELWMTEYKWESSGSVIYVENGDPFAERDNIIREWTESIPGSYNDYRNYSNSHSIPSPIEDSEYKYQPIGILVTDSGISGTVKNGVVYAAWQGRRTGTAKIMAAQYVDGKMTGLQQSAEEADLTADGQTSFFFDPVEDAEYKLFLIKNDESMTPISPVWSGKE